VFNSGSYTGTALNNSLLTGGTAGFQARIIRVVRYTNFASLDVETCLYYYDEVPYGNQTPYATGLGWHDFYREKPRDRRYDWFRDFEHRVEAELLAEPPALCRRMWRARERMDVVQSRRHKRKKFLQQIGASI